MNLNNENAAQPVGSNIAGGQSPAASAKPSVTFAVGEVYVDTRPSSLAALRVAEAEYAKAKGKAPKFAKSVLWRINDVTPDQVLATCIDEPGAREKPVSMGAARALVAGRDWILSAKEPMVALMMSDDHLSTASKARRDKWWNIMTPIIALGKGMWDKDEYAKAAKQITEATKVHRTQIDRVFERLRKGGFAKNSLVGNWFKRRFRTGLGAALLSAVEVNDGVKIPLYGRRRNDETLCLGGGDTSLRRGVHAGDVAKIVQGMKRFGDTELGRGSVKRAWLLTVANYYVIDLVGLQPAEVERKIKGARRLSELPWFPSYDQFRRYLATDTDIKRRLIARLGEKKFNLRHRKTGGRTEASAVGPGANMQIDATRLDVLCAHETTRIPIGRVTVYLVIDCWSHLVTGFYVHVGNEKYDAATLALLCAARNKVDLCKEFDIDIDEAQWPSACLPDRIRADSGLSSLKAHELIRGKYLLHGEPLIEDLTILPSYRADLKGAIESAIGALTSSTVQHLPGYTTGNRLRATVDPKATACLTYRELTKIVVHWILRYNRRHLHSYQRTEPMIRDFVETTPLALWTWGVENVSGARRSWPQELLQSLLLPTSDRAKISRRGLEFGGYVYVPKDPDELPDFEADCIHASLGSEGSQNVSFHPWSVERLWFHTGGKRVAMKLAEGEHARRTWTWYDDGLDVFHTSLMESTRQAENIPAVAVHVAAQNAIVVAAEKATTALRGTVAQRRRDKVDVQAARDSQIAKARGETGHSLVMPDMMPPTPSIGPDPDVQALMNRPQP